MPRHLPSATEEPPKDPNWLSRHGDDLEGRVVPAGMDSDFSVVPVRPTGGMWTSARELACYVQMELSQGLLPDGARLVSRDNLRERHSPPRSQLARMRPTVWASSSISVMEFPVVRHGGGLFGYKSDMIFLPDHGVGAVILTNADAGGHLTYPFGRRLLEVLFDGRPEAAEQAEVAASQRLNASPNGANGSSFRRMKGAIANLAARYTCPDIGCVSSSRRRYHLRFRRMAQRHRFPLQRRWNHILRFDLPAVAGFNFLVSAHDGKHALIARDAQHEYLFVVAAPSN